MFPCCWSCSGDLFSQLLPDRSSYKELQWPIIPVLCSCVDDTSVSSHLCFFLSTSCSGCLLFVSPSAVLLEMTCPPQYVFPEGHQAHGPWLLYLRSGPEYHANRSSKSKVREPIWILERERVILCSLGFLGAGDLFISSWKTWEASTHRRERWQAMWSVETAWSWCLLKKPGFSHSWSQPFLLDLAGCGSQPFLLLPTLSAAQTVPVNVIVTLSINTCHWTTGSFRSLWLVPLNSVSRDPPLHGLTPRWDMAYE